MNDFTQATTSEKHFKFYWGNLKIEIKNYSVWLIILVTVLIFAFATIWMTHGGVLRW